MTTQAQLIKKKCLDSLDQYADALLRKTSPLKKNNQLQEVLIRKKRMNNSKEQTMIES